MPAKKDQDPFLICCFSLGRHPRCCVVGLLAVAEGTRCVDGASRDVGCTQVSERVFALIFVAPRLGSCKIVRNANVRSQIAKPPCLQDSCRCLSAAALQFNLNRPSADRVDHPHLGARTNRVFLPRHSARIHS